MNVTRRLWSKTFNCSLKREENVPVIAVSSFMLFLPIIFYLSNYLHSEQKKRKLIHREYLSITATDRNTREEAAVDKSSWVRETEKRLLWGDDKDVLGQALSDGP